MLIKKYTCPSCGGNKTDEISTGYVYCDYCSSLVDYDLEKMAEEASSSLSSEQLNNPNQQLYFQKLQELSVHIQSEDADNFVKTQCEIHALEFELFPKRFSPKIKQSVFKQKLLEYFESFWYEKIANGYFSENKEVQKTFVELSSNLKFSYEGGKSIPEYNDNFEKYIEKLSEYTKTSIEKTMDMKSIEKYPEPINGASKDVMYKQSINMIIQMYDANTINKLIDKLGLKSEYIEVSNVDLHNTKCFVCNHDISIPEGSKKKVCENCGTTNDIENQKVVCYGCGASFSITDSSACLYCGSKVQILGKEEPSKIKTKNENKPIEIKKEENQKSKKKGFLGKLFG